MNVLYCNSQLCTVLLRCLSRSPPYEVRSLLQSQFSIKCNTVLPTFNFQYLLASLSSSSNCLRRLPRLRATPIFPSITCFRRQFLRKMCPIHVAFLLFFVCRMFLSTLTLCNTFFFSNDRSNRSYVRLQKGYNNNYNNSYITCSTVLLGKLRASQDIHRILMNTKIHSSFNNTHTHTHTQWTLALVQTYVYLVYISY